MINCEVCSKEVGRVLCITLFSGFQIHVCDKCMFEIIHEFTHWLIKR